MPVSAPSAPACAAPVLMARAIALHSAVEKQLLHCTMERDCARHEHRRRRTHRHVGPLSCTELGTQKYGISVYRTTPYRGLGRGSGIHLHARERRDRERSRMVESIERRRLA